MNHYYNNYIIHVRRTEVYFRRINIQKQKIKQGKRFIQKKKNQKDELQPKNGDELRMGTRGELDNTAPPGIKSSSSSPLSIGSFLSNNCTNLR